MFCMRAAHVRALMTQKSCAVGMRNAKLGNHLKAEIKVFFSSSYCCYGNLLWHKNNTNVFSSDWAAF